MTHSEEAKKFEQLAQKIYPQSKLLRAWELKGGVSAQVTALEIDQPVGESETQTQKMVVRRHGERDRQQNPQIAADEFKLLEILQSVGLAAPKPYYLDQAGEIFPTPGIVIEYIEGVSDFAPANLPDFLLQFATQLSKIHCVDWSRVDLSFLPQQEKKYAEKFKNRPARLDESLDEGHIRDILETVWPLPQPNRSRLLHGDFWPGNILWKDGRLVAVIDWEDAEVGDPLADFANSRLEILWAFGPEAMEILTQYYKSMTPLDFTNLPYWDLCAALKPAFRIGEWAGDPIKEQAMRELHRLFITQAYEALSLQ